MASAENLLSAFRPIGAVGNNLDDPSFNPTVNSPELAIAPPNFALGTTDTPVTDLPNPRTISNVVTGGASAAGANAQTDDPSGASAMIYAFGQFVDHDLDLEGSTNTPFNITVPAGDPTFAAGSQIVLDRDQTDPTTGTITNTVAGYLDLSQVYGSDTATAAGLRNADGTMKTSAGDALPIVNGTPPGVPGAGEPTTSQTFTSGDVRVTEQPELTALTTLFVREHNYWVGQLAAANPTWTGDQLYNEAKAITTAEYQNIIYTEYLPALLGANAIGPYTGYNPTVSAQVTQEFSTAAFRVGHSQVSDQQNELDNNGNVTSTESLAQGFFNTPAQDEANDGINSLLRDLPSDNSQAVDVYAVNGLRNLLATNPDQMDLIAIDIQRERDVGLGSLNQTREALGLPAYTSFSQVTSDPTVAADLQATYGDINKLDLFIGGIAEDHVAGSDVGPTFQAIITDQFERLREGDRFWWQNESLDAQTRQIISNTTLSTIINRDTDTNALQQNAFIATERHASDVAATDPTQPQLVIGVDTPGATIAGGPADDTIVVGLGLNQILSGGGGSNVFVYDGPGHTDSITDFNPTADKIQLQPASGDNSLNAMLTADPTAVVTLSDLNNNTVLNIGGNTITLTGVHSDSIVASDFLVPPNAHVDLMRLTTGGREQQAQASSNVVWPHHINA